MLIISDKEGFRQFYLFIIVTVVLRTGSRAYCTLSTHSAMDLFPPLA